jgi:hypothetical protein
MQAAPSLGLQKDESLNPNNPYKTMFAVVNHGYVPATNIEVDCNFSFDSNGIRARNIHLMRVMSLGVCGMRVKSLFRASGPWTSQLSRISQGIS